MEYQKIANLIDDNTLNQPSKFRTRNNGSIKLFKQFLENFRNAFD